MRIVLTLLFCAVGAFGQSAGQGWLDLFPDDHFTGWTRLAMPPTHPPSEIPQWKVDATRRLIVCEGNGGHDMMRYNREFQDFILHVEWRVTPKDGARYNSGVFVRVGEDSTIWHQAQTSPAGGYLFGNTLVHGSPQRFDLRKQMTENRVKPAGEWNVYDIRCEGPKISLSVNGKVTSVFDQCEVPRGYIGLEAEGYHIEFRDLRIKVLK